MDTFSPRTRSSCSTYTSGFLNQLQSEWNEFILEISHSTPQDRTNCDTPKSSNKCGTKAAFIESLNKFNRTSGGNIFIPVPLNTLKKFFSPSKPNVDLFKNDFFKEIEENLNLTKLSCKKLQQLLSVDESNEISDFPSPSLPSHFRSSAPPTLFPVKKSKPVGSAVCKTCDRNAAAINGNLSRRKASAESCKNLIGANSAAKSVESCDVRVAPKNDEKKFSPGEPIPSIDTVAANRKSADNRKAVPVENGYGYGYGYGCDSRPDRNYTGSDSSSLFYTFKQAKKLPKPTIVCTYFDQKELSEIYRIVKRLGFYDVENHVSSRTTHLVCGGSNKTINLCKAIARGCWILDKEWITGSNEANRWLLEERFERNGISPAVRENRMNRQSSGATYRCRVFSNCGSMYVSTRCSQPSAPELKELILLAGGRLEEWPERASYVVGYSPRREYVKEIWILNCLLRGYVVDVAKYSRNASKSKS